MFNSCPVTTHRHHLAPTTIMNKATAITYTSTFSTTKGCPSEMDHPVNKPKDIKHCSQHIYPNAK